jgi:AraC-like DNA-binding protein
LDAALRYLQYSEDYGNDFSEALRTAKGDMLVRLRAWLANHSDAPQPVQIARAMGVSERTLQRRLQTENTNLLSEIHYAQLERARTLLCETDATITHVAFDSGFATPKHFSASFRKRFGTSPSKYRKQRGAKRST